MMMPNRDAQFGNPALIEVVGVQKTRHLCSESFAMEPAGIEPATSCLQSRRSPN
jgi:hypothetical protein